MERTDSIDDGKRLHLLIIIQLLEDLVVDWPVGAKSKTEVRIIKRQAKAWFEHNSKDYQEVCEHAGIDPNQLRKIALESEPSVIQRHLADYRTLSQ